MALPVDFGMEKAALKAQLAKAQAAPVNCAVGKGKEAGAGYILVDHTKSPKSLESTLDGKFKDIKDTRRGTVSLDPEDNKILVFTLNKPASGLAPRLAKILKTVGHAKIRFSYEDGSPPETAEDEEPGQEAPAEHGAEDAAAPHPEAGAIKDRLLGLVKGLAAAIASDPSRKDALSTMARDAQAALHDGDVDTAAAKVDALEAAMKVPPSSGQPAGSDPKAGAVAYGKSRLAWLAVRKKMTSDFEKLGSEMAELHDMPELAGDIKATVQERLEPVLNALDESLADALDDAINATDPAARAKHVDKARGIIVDYQKFVASDQTLAELDENPIVPMRLRATLTATLSTLSAAIH